MELWICKHRLAEILQIHQSTLAEYFLLKTAVYQKKQALFPTVKKTRNRVGLFSMAYYDVQSVSKDVDF